MLTKEMLMKYKKEVLAEEILHLLQTVKELKYDFDKQGTEAQDTIDTYADRLRNMRTNVDDLTEWVHGKEEQASEIKTTYGDYDAGYKQGSKQAWSDIVHALDNVVIWEREDGFINNVPD